VTCSTGPAFIWRFCWNADFPAFFLEVPYHASVGPMCKHPALTWIAVAFWIRVLDVLRIANRDETVLGCCGNLFRSKNPTNSIVGVSRDLRALPSPYSRTMEPQHDASISQAPALSTRGYSSSSLRVNSRVSSDYLRLQFSHRGECAEGR